MMNPFEVFDKRLSNIESLLLSIKYAESVALPFPTQQVQTFTIGELADYLNCTKATIHAYKKRGVFPYYQTGRTVYFKKSEVDAALEVRNKKKGFKIG